MEQNNSSKDKKSEVSSNLEQHSDSKDIPSLNELLQKASEYLRRTKYIEHSKDILSHSKPKSGN